MKRKHPSGVDPLAGTIYAGVVEVPAKPPDAVQVDEANRKAKAAAQARERRDHLLARMAGNIGGGVIARMGVGTGWGRDNQLRELADLSYRFAVEVLKRVEEGE